MGHSPKELLESPGHGWLSNVPHLEKACVSMEGVTRISVTHLTDKDLDKAMCALISSKGGCGVTLCLGAKLASCTTMASSPSCSKFVADKQPHQSPARLCSSFHVTLISGSWADPCTTGKGRGKARRSNMSAA